MYHDEHTLALEDVREGASFLGSARQFCGAFWHIEATAEAGMSERCLNTGRGRKCARKTVVVVARLQQRAAAKPGGWEDLHVARYHNCQRRDGTRAHAETFLVADSRLRARIAALASDDAVHEPSRLVLYMTYQPCHFSGGHTGEQMRSSAMSCTSLLLRYVRDVLSPARVPLELVISYVYRAHWQEGQFPAKYSPAVAAARDGIRLMAGAEEVSLRAFQREDWQSLALLTDAEAQLVLRANGLGVAVGAGGYENGMKEVTVEDATDASATGVSAVGPTADAATGAEVAVFDHAACDSTGGLAGNVTRGRPGCAERSVVFPHLHSAREHLDGFFGTVLRDLQLADASARCEACAVEHRGEEASGASEPVGGWPGGGTSVPGVGDGRRDNGKDRSCGPSATPFI